MGRDWSYRNLHHRYRAPQNAIVSLAVPHSLYFRLQQLLAWHLNLFIPFHSCLSFSRADICENN